MRPAWPLQLLLMVPFLYMLASAFTSVYVGSPADVIGPAPTFQLFHLLIWIHQPH